MSTRELTDVALRAIWALIDDDDSGCITIGEFGRFMRPAAVGAAKGSPQKAGSPSPGKAAAADTAGAPDVEVEVEPAPAQVAAALKEVRRAAAAARSAAGEAWERAAAPEAPVLTASLTADWDASEVAAEVERRKRAPQLEAEQAAAAAGALWAEVWASVRPRLHGLPGLDGRRRYDELEDLLRRQWAEAARLFLAFAEVPHGVKPTLPPKPDRGRGTLLDHERRNTGFSPPATSPLAMRAEGGTAMAARTAARRGASEERAREREDAAAAAEEEEEEDDDDDEEEGGSSGRKRKVDPWQLVHMHVAADARKLGRRELQRLVRAMRLPSEHVSMAHLDALLWLIHPELPYTDEYLNTSAAGKGARAAAAAARVPTDAASLELACAAYTVEYEDVGGGLTMVEQGWPSPAALAALEIQSLGSMSAPVPRKRSQADAFLLQGVELTLSDLLAFLVHAAVWRLHPKHVATKVHPAVWKPSLLECTSRLFDELMPHAAKVAEHAAAEGHPSVPLQGYQTLESGSDVVRALPPRPPLTTRCLLTCCLLSCYLLPATCPLPLATCHLPLAACHLPLSLRLYLLLLPTRCASSPATVTSCARPTRPSRGCSRGLRSCCAWGSSRDRGSSACSTRGWAHTSRPRWRRRGTAVGTARSRRPPPLRQRCLPLLLLLLLLRSI
jgi:hypothetical protein